MKSVTPELTQNAKLVYEVALCLQEQGQDVSRDTLHAVVDLKKVTIDEQIDKLINDHGLMVRKERGVYAPVRLFPPSRAISVTVLEVGTVKIELGNDCIELTPREARQLSTQMVGFAVQFSNIQSGNEAAIIAQNLANKVRKLEARLAGLMDEKRENPNQLGLLPKTTNETLIERARERAS